MKRIDTLPSAHAKTAMRAIYVARFHYNERAGQLQASAKHTQDLLQTGLVDGRTSPRKTDSKAQGARNHNEKKERCVTVRLLEHVCG